VQLLQLDTHQGVHPRLGVVDVVPFIALDESTMHDAILARDEFAHWASSELSVPCFVYGTERTLPDIRRQAWSNLQTAIRTKRPSLNCRGDMCWCSRFFSGVQRVARPNNDCRNCESYCPI